MRKLCILLASLVLLAGCAAKPVFEQVDDVYAPSQVSDPKRIHLELPADASSQVLSGNAGNLYFCDGYEIMIQTFPSGNLDGTLKSLTGYERESLSVLQTRTGELKRYECAWTAAGEGGDRVGRVVVLDDGSYHYCMTVMAPEAEAARLRDTWKALFDSFILG